jgi:Ca-activated chloride channel family protein
MNFTDPIGGMTVLWPRMLWLLALMPVLVAIYLRLGAGRRRAHARLAGLYAAGAAGKFRRRHLPPLFFLAGLCALVAALSRPQAVVLLPSMHKNVILAIDTSGSMRATDVKPNRLAAAQSAARTFVEHQPRNTRVGIVSVSGTASVVQSLTDNHEDLLQAIDRVQLQRGTALGSGIYISLATLLPDADIDLESLMGGGVGRAWDRTPYGGRERKERKPVPAGSNRSVAIVLLSDGENTHGPDPREAAKLAAEYGVRIYTVGIGTTEGIPLGFSGWSMRVRLDEPALRQIAATTQGEYYVANSEQNLKKIYEQLSARMVVERKRLTELTAVFVGAGALFLAISALLSVLWFNRVL